MRLNPFIQNEPTQIIEPYYGRQYAVEAVPEEAAKINYEPAEAELRPQAARRFIQRICVVSALFLVVVFSVLREIQHNRELYHMSQMVAAAEAQAREWQERFRLEQAREAGLEAQLQEHAWLTRAIQITKTDYASAN